VGAPGTGDHQLQLASASSDAGFRSYWRGCAHRESCIVMDSPPALEDVRPWLRMHALLAQAKVRVPQVRAQDADAGFLLLEDLGGATYLDLLDEDNADALFDAALDQLLRIQSIAPPDDLPAYDRPMLMRELRLFDDWFLGTHLGVELDTRETVQLHALYDLLVEAALRQRQVLVHRDFMPRNLMPAGAEAAVLDFQDAVRGPLAYDALSLYKDAFRGWPPARVEGWLMHYRQRALDSGLPVPDPLAFARDADWIGVQRHLKVLGIFARLRHRDRKPRYIADAPRFVGYLADVLPRYPSWPRWPPCCSATCCPRWTHAKLKACLPSALERLASAAAPHQLKNANGPRSSRW
jgi:aminoglycoside/choline kinase family phosphotransferase